MKKLLFLIFFILCSMGAYKLIRKYQGIGDIPRSTIRIPSREELEAEQKEYAQKYPTSSPIPLQEYVFEDLGIRIKAPYEWKIANRKDESSSTNWLELSKGDFIQKIILNPKVELDDYGAFMFNRQIRTILNYVPISIAGKELFLCTGNLNFTYEAYRKELDVNRLLFTDEELYTLKSYIIFSGAIVSNTDNEIDPIIELPVNSHSTYGIPIRLVIIHTTRNTSLGNRFMATVVDYVNISKEMNLITSSIIPI